MTIEVSDLKAGGAVTYKTTTGVLVTGTIKSDLSGLLYVDLGSLSGSIRYPNGCRGRYVDEILAYTPPKPEWDRPEVRVVMEECTFSIYHRATRRGVLLEDLWSGPVSTFTTEELAEKHPDLVVWAVAP